MSKVTTKLITIPDSGQHRRLHVVAGACSFRGLRRDTNEDSHFMCPNMDLFIVADGMGGHAAGEVASRFAVDVLSHELAKIATDTTEEENGDRYLLASDGLTDVMDEDRILKIIKENNDPQMAAGILAEEAILNGAGDDVTCVVFYVQSDSGSAAAAKSSPTRWRRLSSLFERAS